MRTIKCSNCNNEFPARQYINGEAVSLYKRKFCLECSPYGCHNTSKMPRKTGISYIFQLSKEEFNDIIQECESRSEFFRKLNTRKSGASYQILNRRIKEENIDISHFKKPHELVKLRGKRSYEDILVENSDYPSTSNLKERLVKDGLMVYECQECGNEGHHNQKPLVLQLHHKNGIRNDNRLENLCLLCPNCHTQTDTYSRRNTI